MYRASKISGWSWKQSFSIFMLLYGLGNNTFCSTSPYFNDFWGQDLFVRHFGLEREVWDGLTMAVHLCLLPCFCFLFQMSRWPWRAFVSPDPSHLPASMMANKALKSIFFKVFPFGWMWQFWKDWVFVELSPCAGQYLLEMWVLVLSLVLAFSSRLISLAAATLLLTATSLWPVVSEGRLQWGTSFQLNMLLHLL